MQWFETFFRDYGTPFATLVAVLNTVVSVTIGQLFSKSPRAAKLLVVLSIILGIVAVGGTFYSQYQIVAKATADAAQHVAVREELGIFIQEGETLKDQCEDAATPLPETAAADWLKRLLAFITANLGTSYVSRLSDKTGALPMIMNVPAERRGLWLGLYMRIYRLEEFSRELAR